MTLAIESTPADQAPEELSEPETPPAASAADAVLRDWIVSALPGWQRAYRQLLIDRYGHVVAQAARRYGVRRLGLGAPADLHGEVCRHLHGASSDWAPLRSWSPKAGPFEPWLATVVRRMCLAVLRRKRKFGVRGKREVTLESMDAPVGNNDAGRPTALVDTLEAAFDGLAEVERRLLVERTRRCLERMAEDDNPRGYECFLVLVMYYWDGLTDAEVGRELNRTREWANRTRRQRCLPRLRRCLEGEADGGR